MDGKGRAMDNIFVERLWRSLKYEEVYLKEYTTQREARDGAGNYLHFYDHPRKHQALGYRTLAEVYNAQLNRRRSPGPSAGTATASSSALRRPAAVSREMSLETNKPNREIQPENRGFRVRKMWSTSLRKHRSRRQFALRAQNDARNRARSHQESEGDAQ